MFLTCSWFNEYDHCQWNFKLRFLFFLFVCVFMPRWQYGIQSILEVHIRRLKEVWSWPHIRQHRHRLRAYRAAYQSHLMQGKTKGDMDTQIKVCIWRFVHCMYLCQGCHLKTWIDKALKQLAWYLEHNLENVAMGWSPTILRSFTLCLSWFGV